MTDEQAPADPSDPKNAPMAGTADLDADHDPASHDLAPGSRHPLKAEQEEPDVKPFAGDDDILSGHGPGAIE